MVGAMALAVAALGVPTVAGAQEEMNPQIEVFPGFDIVIPSWHSESTMTVRVERGGSEVYVAAVDDGGWFNLWQHPFDLLAGDQVTVTDGIITKEHLVRNHTITALQPAPANRVEGIADPGTMLLVRLNTIQSGLGDDDMEAYPVTADGNGDWSVDFDTDLVPGLAVEAVKADEPVTDNDQTIVVDYLPLPTITAHIPDTVTGAGWPDGATVDITVDDVGVAPSPVADRFGFPWDTSFEAPLVSSSGDTWLMLPGDVVTASDGPTTKEHVVLPVTFDGLSAEADMATGTAPADCDVHVVVWGDSGSAALWVTAGAGGEWSADFGGVGFDIVPGTEGEARVLDADYDATAATWEPAEAGYTFSGFAAPIDSDAVNLATAGRTVPLRFRVTTSAGDAVGDLTDVTVTVQDLSCALGTTEDQIEEYAAGNSGLLNLGDGYYQYNWKTPRTYKGSCKLLLLDLGDGVPHSAEFHFVR